MVAEMTADVQILETIMAGAEALFGLSCFCAAAVATKVAETATASWAATATAAAANGLLSF